jgi:hypothetical protein
MLINNIFYTNRMRIYTIQKLVIYLRNGMFSYFEIINTLDNIKIENNCYDELINKYNYLFHIKYLNGRLIIDDELCYNSNPSDFFTNGIYKTDEDSNDYYLISYVDV